MFDKSAQYMNKQARKTENISKHNLNLERMHTSHFI